MKRLVCVVALAGSVFLAGCETTGKPFPERVTEVVAQVQAITRQVCDFIPVAEVVAQIIRVGDYTAPVAIANAICTAVHNLPKATRGTKRPVPVVSGVVVKGQYVR